MGTRYKKRFGNMLRASRGGSWSSLPRQGVCQLYPQKTV